MAANPKCRAAGGQCNCPNADAVTCPDQYAPAQASDEPMRAVRSIGTDPAFEAAAKKLHLTWTVEGVHALINAADAFVASQVTPRATADVERDAVLEYAALICEGLESDMFDQYKGRGKHEPFNPHRGDTYMNGQSDGAGQCSAAIRKCKADSSGALETQPGSPNFDGAAAFEAFQAAGGYEMDHRAELAKLLADAQPGDAT